MQIEDFSTLKPVGDVEVPLNGTTYFAIPDPPTEVVLAATGANIAEDEVEAIAHVMQHGEADTAPEVLGVAVRASHQATRRALQFLQDVLRPESAERWAANMRTQRDAEGKVVPNPESISLAQCMAVYRALVQVYANRPTEPPSPSRNGHGGTGEASTAGLPLGG